MDALGPETPLRTGMFIGGEWTTSLGGVAADIDPSTGGELASVSQATTADVEAAVRAAREAFDSGPWATQPPAERGRVLQRIAALIRQRAASLARLESLDTGKPLRQARADAEVAARYFEFYSGVADKIMGETIPLGMNMTDLTLREPIGVSAQIVPWNYPLQIGARGIAPALAAGCTIRRAAARDPRLTLDVLIDRVDELLDGVALLSIDRALLLAAGALAEPALRALDAIHVAAAVDLAPLDGFVSYDERQAAAARLAGVRTMSPGS